LSGPLQPLQRFLCNACRATFTFERKSARPRRRFTDDLAKEAVRIYVQGLSSYRVLATMLEQRLDTPVSRFTLNSWILELGACAKTPLEVSIELAPKWGGFLGIDGKVIFINGKQHCLLIGVDHPTQDLVHALVLPVENSDGFARLETEARFDAGYPLLGVVSDLGPGFAGVHRDHFGAGSLPGLPRPLRSPLRQRYSQVQLVEEGTSLCRVQRPHPVGALREQHRRGAHASKRPHL
jgi:transposase-like protein